VAFQVTISLPVLLLAAVTAVVEERAQGNLDVLLATPLSTRTIVLTKWWCAFRALPLFLVLPAVLTIASAWPTGAWAVASWLDFPPKSTVWRYFDQWRRDGTLDRIHERLRRKVCTTEKPYHPRTSASVDSQSIDTTSGGEQRGRDNAKNAAAGHHRQSGITVKSVPSPSATWISER
jgi:transposase